MQPAKKPKALVIERLHANRKPIDSYISERAGLAFVERGGVAFDGPLELAARVERGAHAGKPSAELIRIPEARRSPAEEDALDAPPHECRRSCIEFAKDRARIPRVIDRRLDVAHEVAIRALGQAPGKMHVNAGTGAAVCRS